MTKYYLVLTAYLLSYSFVTAQKTDYKNSIRVGVDYMVLSTSEDIGVRYLTRYAHHFNNDRIIVEGSLGYLSASGPRSLFTEGGQHRRRITGEITALYDFLRSSSQALRLGVGPSIWNRRDDSTPWSTYQIKETNVGAHLVTEYEYAITSKLTVAGRYGLAYLFNAGPSSMLGLNVGYRF